jgi:hypothetical protein
MADSFKNQQVKTQKKEYSHFEANILIEKCHQTNWSPAD